MVVFAALDGIETNAILLPKEVQITRFKYAESGDVFGSGTYVGVMPSHIGLSEQKRLWFFSLDDAEARPEAARSVTMDHQKRYLSSRGNR